MGIVPIILPSQRKNSAANSAFNMGTTEGARSASSWGRKNTHCPAGVHKHIIPIASKRHWHHALALRPRLPAPLDGAVGTGSESPMAAEYHA